MADIAIVGGGGYVGLAYAVAFAELGHRVVGLDTDQAKVVALQSGQSTIYEPGLDDLLQRGLTSGRLAFTTDYAVALATAEVAFICVGTPPDEVGRADTTYVAAAARGIATHAVRDVIVVNKSTMPVGSVQFVAEVLAEHARPGVNFSVISNPEFLREGAAIHDIFHPDRIVLGTDDPEVARRVSDLYAALDAPVLVTDPRSAEMIKYASNALLATKISFINEVALICERVGADAAGVAQGMGMDHRINPRFLVAGVGFGGSCFPKDVRALAAMALDAGLHPNLLTAVLAINAHMRAHVIELLGEHLGDLAGKTIAVLGLAFKPETDDVREAPALAVIRELLAAGACVRATDPVAMPNAASQITGATLCKSPYATVTGADAVVLMTEWQEYQTLDLDQIANAMRGSLIIDGRNALDPRRCEASGLAHLGIGRGGHAPQRAPSPTLVTLPEPVRQQAPSPPSTPPIKVGA
jgi:UDPglucose 6-dehydrogenase